MKILLESWKKYLVEYTRAWSDPEKVKIVSQILYYYPEGGRLFLVAEFEEFVDGPKMKFGFYTTRGESVAGTEDSAFGWVPIYGISDSGWIMKIPGKYAHEDSLLGMVGKQLTKLVPSDRQHELRRANKGEIMAYERSQIKQGKNSEQVRNDSINQQITQINAMFKKHGVYKKAPKEIKKDELEDYEQEFEPKSSGGSSIR